jgi:glycosyltransferase involved in cell wall biosynthesis
MGLRTILGLKRRARRAPKGKTDPDKFTGGADSEAPSTAVAEHPERWTGKNLYFGNIYPHERQYTVGNFVGLALNPKFDRDIRHDAYRRLPIDDGSVARVQAQDVFEHLEFEKTPAVLDEIYRVLAPNGVFRLSVPDYRSPVLRVRSVYDEHGNVIADLMMGGRVRYDEVSRQRKVEFSPDGESHLWFPTYEKINQMISRSAISRCGIIKFYHCFLPDGSAVCDPFPENDMPVMRAPPSDMRANGQPVSIIVDFIKQATPNLGGHTEDSSAGSSRAIAPAQSGAAAVPGIGIVTYMRPDHLAKCLRQLQRHTKGACEVVVACDSPDDLQTAHLCADFGAGLIQGENRGVVWNKNRALYHFMSNTNCDPIILLEDDTYPVSDDWIAEWVSAAARWHHVNFSHPAILQSNSLVGGEGTSERPYIHRLVTGQCTAVSRKAMEIGGYLDTRFRGYGHGHVEWTKRHNALLFGNLVADFSPHAGVFLSIVGGLKSDDARSFRSETDVQRNSILLRETDRAPRRYRDPWQSPDERQVLAREIEAMLPIKRRARAKDDAPEAGPSSGTSEAGCS